MKHVIESKCQEMYRVSSCTDLSKSEDYEAQG